MTNKELQKLGRRELLQLLLNQAKDTERLTGELAEAQAQLQELNETYERLRDRLNHKDERIHELEAILEEEREKREVDLEDVGSIAEAALKLHGVFDAAQEAADFYLRSIRELYPLPEGVELSPLPEEQPLAQAKYEAEPESRAELGVEPDFDPEPRPAPRRERRPAERRSGKAPGKRIVPDKKEKKKLTLFFGWQHD